MKRCEKPRVSFIIPIFNGAPFIANTLECLREQTFKEIEIIVIDDGSTDSLPDLMDYYAKVDKRIKYIRFKDNKGAARCRNYGNKIAGADIICVTDCGDRYPKDKASLVYRYFKSHPHVSVFSTGVTGTDEFGYPIFTQITRVFKGKPGEKPNISHPTASYRKWVALKYPYRETSKATDNYEAFFLTLARNGIKFGATNKIYLRKPEMGKYRHCRDITEARRVKYEVYKEFGIHIPDWLQVYSPEKQKGSLETTQQVSLGKRRGGLDC